MAIRTLLLKKKSDRFDAPRLHRLGPTGLKEMAESFTTRANQLHPLLLKDFRLFVIGPPFASLWIWENFQLFGLLSREPLFNISPLHLVLLFQLSLPVEVGLPTILIPLHSSSPAPCPLHHPLYFLSCFLMPSQLSFCCLKPTLHSKSTATLLATRK